MVLNDQKLISECSEWSEDISECSEDISECWGDISECSEDIYKCSEDISECWGDISECSEDNLWECAAGLRTLTVMSIIRTKTFLLYSTNISYCITSCLSVCLSACLPACLSVCLSVCLLLLHLAINLSEKKLTPLICLWNKFFQSSGMHASHSPHMSSGTRIRVCLFK